MSTPNFGPFLLGGNVFGWTVPRDEAFPVLDAFVEKGGHAIDTADVYSAWIPGNKGGESEEILGAWLKARNNRSKIFLSTKVAKWGEQPGLSAKNITSAVERSLKRLGTDYIDLYFAHEDDAKVEQSEYVRAFDDLVKAGKVRTLGASNFTPERLASARKLQKDGGLATFDVAQDQWSLVERDFEKNLKPLLEREGIVETPYWALASGFLSGKYRPGKKVDSARADGVGKYLARPDAVKLLDVLDTIAGRHGVSVTAVALGWLKQQSVVTVPIVSARTVDQLGPLFETVKLTADELDELSAVTK